MRVTSIELHPQNSSNVIVLSYRDPTRQNEYSIEESSGLDADAITPKYYGSSGNSSDLFYALSLESREVVLKISLNPKRTLGHTYSDLRDTLYKMISSSRTGLIDLWFKDGSTVNAVLSVWVTKFDSPQSVRNPKVTLTLTADEKFLKGPSAISPDVSEWDTLSTLIQDEVSTAPHGFKFSMSVTDDIPTLSIFDPFDTSWTFTATPIGGFLDGDEIYFSSEPNDKQFYVIRSLEQIYMADSIQPDSLWPIIFPGDNHLTFADHASLHWVNASYTHTFWGI